MKSLVMTVLSPDRTGLVRTVSDTIAANGGNWLESRMARLSGQFAGIIRIECPQDAIDSLIEKLNELAAQGIVIQTVLEESAPTPPRVILSIDVVGNDRPGIVRELTGAIAQAGGNLEEFTTGLENAPMSGHPIFRARGIISIPENAEASTLTSAIENLGTDLSVEIS
jgi:glycine cleavage system regulatory protein